MSLIDFLFDLIKLGLCHIYLAVKKGTKLVVYRQKVQLTSLKGYIPTWT